MKKNTTSNPKAKKESVNETAEKKSSTGEGNKKNFLVVGLGASAGGVKALQEFFATMPPNSGMAFVVILHLSPEHESSLAEIIQAQTAMPVVKVTETHQVEPNHVYVIPPNSQLEMFDGVVRCVASNGKSGARVAVDTFFRTLADVYERNGVCIVLSGTGTDGTIGLKHIKERNGFAIVQDPQDAEYDGMPRSAIATKLVDWILPVRRMPEYLINFRDSSERLHLTDGDDRKVAKEIQADESLREILTILRVRTGHDFSNYKTPTLIRRIARHLQIHNLEDIPSYLTFLRANPNEIQSLMKNLLINVTNFFRDKEAFAALEQEIIPNLFAEKKSRDTVRVWSCGCASGEEAYSLAMLLSEYAYRLSDPPRIQVFATDVDEDAISEARENRYPESIEADVSPERLKRFFVKEGNYYRIKKELREMILFAPHNVLRDPPFSRLDLISCRNLLIYLNRETQERVMEIFHFALVPNGYLFLGSSETADSVPNLFGAINKKYRIYSRRPVHTGLAVPPKMPQVGQWQVTLPQRKPYGIRRDAAFSLGEVHYKLLESIAPPAILVNSDFTLLYLSDSASRFVRMKGGEPSNNLLKLVHPDLLPDLRAALFAAQRRHKVSEFENVRAVIEGAETFVNLTVRPVEIDNEARDFMLVIFEENKLEKTEEKSKEKKSIRVHTKDDAMEAVVRQLEEELFRTKTQLRATIEQHEVSIEELKASNEELQAINEELRSTTEELETSKEELQSVNEELTTVNHELKEKMDETTRTNSDLQNLMASTDIATLFLDRHLNIKRITPPVEKLFNITPADAGRPLEHFTHKLQYENLVADAEQSLRSLSMLEREIQDHANRTFMARFLPYRTVDDRIEGVVLNFIDITERKRAEEAKFFLAAIVESSEDSMLTVNFDGIITSWNKGSEKLYGYTAREAIGKPLAMLSLPEDLKLVLSKVDEIKHNQRVKIFDSIRLHKDGHEMNLEVVLSPVRNDKDQIIGVSTLARDVTEQREADETLRKSEEKYRTLFNSIDEGYCIIEVLFDKRGNPYDWRFLEVNPAFEKNSGLKNAAGKNMLEMTPNIEPKWFDIYGSIARSGEPLRREEHSAALKRWFNLYAFPVGAPEENKVAVIFTDITRNKETEEALRKGEEHLNLILESTKDYAIITFDLKGRITRWNAGAEKIFGWTEAEAIGQTTHLIFTREDCVAKEPEKEMAHALKDGRAEDERWHIRKDGSRFYASGVMQQLRDGKLEGFVKICRDETVRLKTEKAMREKELLQQFVAAQENERDRIARDIHDHLGQQLTALRLRLEAVKKMCDDAAVCDEIEIIQESAAQLDRDIDFIAWELRPAALADLGLRATLANFIREWSNYTGIKAEFHTTGLSRTNIDFDSETNLYRIAQEALNNIHKHANAKKVSVLLEKRNGKIVLIVEDDGIGFNKENKKIKSKGIGLSGMSERAKILGGELEIESEPGSGTTVFARVPLKENES
jgi:two-component system CheB/CheR fusion protein